MHVGIGKHTRKYTYVVCAVRTDISVIYDEILHDSAAYHCEQTEISMRGRLGRHTRNNRAVSFENAVESTRSFGHSVASPYVPRILGNVRLALAQRLPFRKITHRIGRLIRYSQSDDIVRGSGKFEYRSSVIVLIVVGIFLCRFVFPDRTSVSAFGKQSKRGRSDYSHATFFVRVPERFYLPQLRYVRYLISRTCGTAVVHGIFTRRSGMRSHFCRIHRARSRRASEQERRSSLAQIDLVPTRIRQSSADASVVCRRKQSSSARSEYFSVRREPVSVIHTGKSKLVFSLIPFIRHAYKSNSDNDFAVRSQRGRIARSVYRVIIPVSGVLVPYGEFRRSVRAYSGRQRSRHTYAALIRQIIEYQRSRGNVHHIVLIALLCVRFVVQYGSYRRKSAIMQILRGNRFLRRRVVIRRVTRVIVRSEIRERFSFVLVLDKEIRSIRIRAITRHSRTLHVVKTYRVCRASDFGQFYTVSKTRVYVILELSALRYVIRSVGIQSRFSARAVNPIILHRIADFVSNFRSRAERERCELYRLRARRDERHHGRGVNAVPARTRARVVVRASARNIVTVNRLFILRDVHRNEHKLRFGLISEARQH